MGVELDIKPEIHDTEKFQLYILAFKPFTQLAHDIYFSKFEEKLSLVIILKKK